MNKLPISKQNEIFALFFPPTAIDNENRIFQISVRRHRKQGRDKIRLISQQDQNSNNKRLGSCSIFRGIQYSFAQQSDSDLIYFLNFLDQDFLIDWNRIDIGAFRIFGSRQTARYANKLERINQCNNDTTKKAIDSDRWIELKCTEKNNKNMKSQFRKANCRKKKRAGDRIKMETGISQFSISLSVFDSGTPWLHHTHILHIFARMENRQPASAAVNNEKQYRS